MSKSLKRRIAGGLVRGAGMVAVVAVRGAKNAIIGERHFNRDHHTSDLAADIRAAGGIDNFGESPTPEQLSRVGSSDAYRLTPATVARADRIAASRNDPTRIVNPGSKPVERKK